MNAPFVSTSHQVEIERELGACCACEQPKADVRNICMLDFQAPEGFNGWGCYVCHLPHRGAIAVLCDECMEAGREPVTICAGRFASDGERVRLEGFEQRPHGHNLKAHGVTLQ